MMALTFSEIELVFEELRPLLVDGAFQRVYEADPRTLVFQVRQPGETHYVLVSTEPGHSRMYGTDGKPSQPPHPSPFTMQLRKWVQGARVIDARVANEDRIVELELSASVPEAEEGQGRTTLFLEMELTGHHGNVFLLDADRVVLGQQHHHRDARELAPGEAYQYPPKPDNLRTERRVRFGLEDVPVGERSSHVASRLAESRREQAFNSKLKSLRARLKSSHKKLRRRRGHIEEDLDRAEEADRYRRWGELLQSAYGQEIPRGAESIEVPDFYQEDMPTVEIPLDPSRNLQQNIERYFHEYRRMDAAVDLIEDRLLTTMELVDVAAEARERAAECETLDAIEELEQEMIEAGVLEPKRVKRKQKRSGPKPPYREFRTQQEAVVLVGRGPKRNDELTTSVARGRDVWLHARDWAGAHVVMRMRKDDEPDGQDLLDAAMLAAHFSKGKNDTFVDVTYTRAKHVRKPKGAAPGLVTVADANAITVRREPERLEALLATEIPQ